MPLFSKKQIDAAHELITGQWMTVNQLAKAMDCNIRDAWQLIKLVKQKYPAEAKSSKPIDKFLQKGKGIDRPAAEYSNKRLYDLI